MKVSIPTDLSIFVDPSRKAICRSDQRGVGATADQADTCPEIGATTN
jgi:hypothetical protein